MLREGVWIARAAPQCKRTEDQQHSDHDQGKEHEAGERQLTARPHLRAGRLSGARCGLDALIGSLAAAAARLDVHADLGIRSTRANGNAGERGGRHRCHPQRGHHRNQWNALCHWR